MFILFMVYTIKFNEKGYVKDDMICNINIDMYKFLKLYNNNYRPIYHLELFLFNIIKHIHRL